MEDSNIIDRDDIYKLCDGSVIFTLFHDYSDYGSQNILWQIKDGELIQYKAWETPERYITGITLSPDKTSAVIQLGSRKSTYLEVIDFENMRISEELIAEAHKSYA